MNVKCLHIIDISMQGQGYYFFKSTVYVYNVIYLNGKSVNCKRYQIIQIFKITSKHNSLHFKYL